MRNIINISLPEATVKEIKKDIRIRKFASTSEFFRHVLRVWNTYKLAEELEESRKYFEKGEGRVLKSFRDLR